MEANGVYTLVKNKHGIKHVNIKMDDIIQAKQNQHDIIVVNLLGDDGGVGTD